VLSIILDDFLLLDCIDIARWLRLTYSLSCRKNFPVIGYNINNEPYNGKQALETG